MKTFNALALFCVFVSVALAVPVPVREGKQGAVDPPTLHNSRPPSPDVSRPPSPGPSPSLSHPPLLGRTGHHTVNGLTTIYYGDDPDGLPGHMRHVERNQERHPENLNPMELAHRAANNRRDALRGISTKGDKVRDEKMPAMFHNPNHDKTTTVEYRDSHESSKEGGLLRGAKAAIEAGGKGAKGQLRPNRGWLPLDPSQRRGHEAPAKLNSQNFNGKPQQYNVKKQPKAKVVPPKHDPEGYTPVTKGGMSLRHREGRDPPPPPKTPAPKKATGSGTNLQKGTPAKPQGHVFKGISEKYPQQASHFGAPAPPSNSRQRHPPRPQNQAHHEKMQEEARKKAARGNSGGSQAHHDDTAPPRHDAARYHSNLQRFNQERRAPRVGHGHSRSVEAPARLETHHHYHHHHHHSNQPSTSNSHDASTSHNTQAHAAPQHPPAAPRRRIPVRPATPETPTPNQL